MNQLLDQDEDHMSRLLTLEEYLEQFVDENTQSAGDDLTLLVTEQQAQTLGFFFINGLAGILERAKLDRCENCDDKRLEKTGEAAQDEFIN